MVMKNNMLKIQSIDVHSRLSELFGVDEHEFRQAIISGNLSRQNLTADHPKISRGFVMWMESTASLRKILRPKGWERHEVRNFERTVNRNLGIAILICSGDELTGTDATPSNKYFKGNTTKDAIALNQQLDMFPNSLPQEMNLDSNEDGFDTWILLHYIDKWNEIRIEISRPCSMIDKKITDWAERIILQPIPLGRDDGYEPDNYEPEFYQDIDVEVKRRGT